MGNQIFQKSVTVLVLMFVWVTCFNEGLAAMCCAPAVIPVDHGQQEVQGHVLHVRERIININEANNDRGRYENAVCCYRAPDYMTLLDDWKFDTKFQFFTLGSGMIAAIYYAVQKNQPWENLQFGLSVVGAVYGLKLLWSSLSKTPCAKTCCRP